ncbi:hypothetical protein BP5796_08422 [Coleophoma crateriformis]|uniref:Major facilitator superfamily (MFS) profile domain-containing protein n=1 Tax=Coleophoma crateriformis TaxID=565419 RepID=A0A3D8R7J2_9HELO|nr:hypothetical protein BP5796_08422 [Coleophoma crateriformis]
MSSTTLPGEQTPPTMASSLDLEKLDAELPASSVPEAAEYVRPISNVRWYLVCLGLYLSALLYGLDTTIAADVQGPILQSLGEIEKLAWVGIGFPMGSVSIILLVGCCYGLFDIKYLVISSLTVFEIGSAICGAAQNMNMMIVGRVIAGMGGAGMYLGALTYVSIFTSVRERPIYNALIGLCWGSGAILGPVIGGGFAVSSATWRWAFYINLPLAAAVAPIFFFLVPNFNPAPDRSTREKLAQLDWVGAILNAAVFTIFQVVLTFAGSTWKWDSAGPITLWIVLGVATILYAVQQTFSIFTTPEMRLFPVQFLKSRTMLLLYFATAACSTGLSIGVYYIPLFFQFTHGDSAIQAAVRLLPYICLVIFCIMLSGALLPVFGRYQPFFVLTGILLVVGGALMHTVTASTSPSTIYGYEVLMAIGAGLSMQIGYSIVVVKVAPHEIAAAIGYMNVAQIGSMAIGLSIGGSILQNRGFINLRDALSAYHFSEQELRAALGGAQSVILQGGDAQVRTLAIEAIAKTLQSLWVLTIVAGAVALVSGVFMKREKLVLAMTAGG